LFLLLKGAQAMINQDRKSRTAGLFFAVLLCCVATTGHTQQYKIGHGGEPMHNVDLPGSDIDHKLLEGPSGDMLDLRQEECAKLCWKNDECVAWTYVKPNTIQGPKGNCWLKNKVPAKAANSCCVSGTVGEANTDRPGGDYKHFDSINGADVTPQQCSKTCFNDPQCKAWTFVKPNTIQGPKGVCWLKNTVPDAVPNNACISGWFDIQEVK
jgi:hypothetical protein